jgi:hypothetical protein
MSSFNVGVVAEPGGLYTVQSNQEMLCVVNEWTQAKSRDVVN